MTRAMQLEQGFSPDRTEHGFSTDHTAQSRADLLHVAGKEAWKEKKSGYSGSC